MFCLVDVGLLIRKTVLESRSRIVPLPEGNEMLLIDEVFSKTSPLSCPVANTWIRFAVSFRRTIGRVRIGDGVETTNRLQPPPSARTRRSCSLLAFLPATNT